MRAINQVVLPLNIGYINFFFFLLRITYRNTTIENTNRVGVDLFKKEIA